MALSEHDERVLAEPARSLNDEDPALARRLRGAPPTTASEQPQRRALLLSLGLLLADMAVFTAGARLGLTVLSLLSVVALPVVLRPLHRSRRRRRRR